MFVEWRKSPSTGLEGALCRNHKAAGKSCYQHKRYVQNLLQPKIFVQHLLDYSCGQKMELIGSLAPRVQIVRGVRSQGWS